MHNNEQMAAVRRSEGFIKLKNHVGMTKEIKLGYDWFWLFLAIVAVFVKGYWKQAFIALGVNFILTLMSVSVGDAGLIFVVLNWIFHIWWGSVIQKRYARQLILQGWMPSSEADEVILREKGIYNL